MTDFERGFEIIREARKRAQEETYIPDAQAQLEGEEQEWVLELVGRLARERDEARKELGEWLRVLQEAGMYRTARQFLAENRALGQTE